MWRIVIIGAAFALFGCPDSEETGGQEGCTDKVTQCGDGTILKCVDGEWKPWTDCNPGEQCVVRQGEARCVSGSDRDGSGGDGDADESGGDGDADGDSDGDGDPTRVCGEADLAVDHTGWVARADNGCGIAGEWWWAVDGVGSALDNAPEDAAPYREGSGMCLSGTLADDLSAFALIGLSLNEDAAVGWDAARNKVVGFEFEVEGETGGAELRIGFDSLTERTTATPFVPIQTGEGVGLIMLAEVPRSWEVSNAGEVPDASNLRQVIFQLAGDDIEREFDFCVTRIRPLVGSCGDYAQRRVNGYVVHNNTWGREDITAFEQCVFGYGAGDDALYGWGWDWPKTTPAWQVRAYPEIMAGKSPWSNIDTGHGLPARTDAEVSFTFDLQLAADSDGVYNVAPEVWLTTDIEPTSDNIAYEIMIWLDYNGMSPAGAEQPGQYVDPNTGVPFEVWVNQGHDPGADSTAGWTYVALRARRPVHSGTIALKPMVAHLKRAGIVADRDFYYAGVEVGTEIVNGRGSAVFRSFSVDVGGGADGDSDADADTDIDTDADSDSDIEVDCDGGYSVHPRGYVCAGPWEGYAWTSAGEVSGAYVVPEDYSDYTGGESAFCAAGYLATDYDSVGMLGLNVKQEENSLAIGSWTPEAAYDGIYVDYTNYGSATVRLVVQSAEGESYCAEVYPGGDLIFWDDLQTECWKFEGAVYRGEAISNVMLLVPGSERYSVDFDICLNVIGPI